MSREMFFKLVWRMMGAKSEFERFDRSQVFGRVELIGEYNDGSAMWCGAAGPLSTVCVFTDLPPICEQEATRYGQVGIVVASELGAMGVSPTARDRELLGWLAENGDLKVGGRLSPYGAEIVFRQIDDIGDEYMVAYVPGVTEAQGRWHSLRPATDRRSLDPLTPMLWPPESA